MESTAGTEYQDDDYNVGDDQIVEADEGDAEIESNSDDHVSKVSVENRSDEDVENHDNGDDHECSIRSGRVRKLHDFEKHFPETDHTQFGTTNSRWLKPQHCNEVSVVEKSSDGILHSESCFSEDAVTK